MYPKCYRYRNRGKRQGTRLHHFSNTCRIDLSFNPKVFIFINLRNSHRQDIQNLRCICHLFIYEKIAFIDGTKSEESYKSQTHNLQCLNSGVP
jgi:hypothetical protein